MEVFTCEHAPLCPLSPIVQAHKVHCVGTPLGLTLTMSMLAICPGVSQVLFLPGHQHRSTEVMSQNCSSLATGLTVGAMDAAQTVAWPNPHMYMPTKSTAAEARAIPAAGALIILSDILQALNLGCHQWRCNSIVCAAVRREFGSSFLVTQPLGLSFGFSSSSG